MTNRMVKLRCANGAENLFYSDYSSLIWDILRVEPKLLRATVFSGFLGRLETVDLFLSHESTIRYNHPCKTGYSLGTIDEEELNDTVFVLKKTPLKNTEAVLYDGEAYLLTFGTGLIEPCTIKGVVDTGYSNAFKVHHGGAMETLSLNHYGSKYVFLEK